MKTKRYIIKAKDETVEHAMRIYDNSRDLPRSKAEAKSRLPMEDWRDLSLYEITFRRIPKGKEPKIGAT
jgi:hypothetical protein